MAWTTMHFAVGMACTGATCSIVCAVTRRGWRWIPPLMTLGGIWANIPDMPRFWRIDFPWLPFASTLGSIDLEHFLHHWGDIFFFHAALDDQPNAYALHGLLAMLLLYNLSIAQLLYLEHRQRALRRVPLVPAHPRARRPAPPPPRIPLPTPAEPEFDIQRLIQPAAKPARREP